MGTVWIKSGGGGVVLKTSGGSIYVCDSCPCVACACCDTNDPMAEISITFPSSFSDGAYAGVAALLNGQTFILASSGNCTYDYDNIGTYADWEMSITATLSYTGDIGDGNCSLGPLNIEIRPTDPSATDDCLDGIGQVNIDTNSSVAYDSGDCQSVTITDSDLTVAGTYETACDVVQFSSPIGNFSVSA